MSFFDRISGWFGRGGAIREQSGPQNPVPGVNLVTETSDVGVDGALQISTVWACIDRRATIVASLPLFAYKKDADGHKKLARGDRIFDLLHESPNSRMTPFEFWRAMMLNYDLRGNAYARIERDTKGEAIAMWPMPADQVQPVVLADGSMVYEYRYGVDVAVLADSSVLHIKNLGNGTVGLSKLEFMRASTDEAAKAQQIATRLFANGGKPTGILMIDAVLNDEQRKKVRANFEGLASGSTSRLQLLEANMKYEQISLTPEQQQLFETRKYGVEDLCRWFDVPPVLVHHSNVTAWGTGIFEIKDGFYTLALAPLCINIQQALRKRVMTSKQRATMEVEFNIDALLRASIKDRFEIYAKAAQNGLKTRNEMRQLENDPPLPGGNVLTVQSNLVPIDMLGKIKPTGASAAQDTAQAQ
jgi:HK97 family phage portal protein